MSDLSFSATLTHRVTNVQLTARELFQTSTLELNAFAAGVRKFSFLLPMHGIVWSWFLSSDCQHLMCFIQGCADTLTLIGQMSGPCRTLVSFSNSNWHSHGYLLSRGLNTNCLCFVFQIASHQAPIYLSDFLHLYTPSWLLCSFVDTINQSINI